MLREDFRRHGHGLVEWIADYLEDPRQYPVLARCSPGELQRQLPAAGAGKR
jgi:aromatic-L-amino-acid decarboxylase